MNDSRRATLFLFSTTVIWGSTFPVCKIAVTEAMALGARPWAAVFALWTARFAMAAVAFALVPGALRIGRRECFGAFMITWPGAIGLAMQGRSLVGGTSTVVAFLTNLMVVFTPVFGFAFFREKIPRSLIVGAAVALGGVFLLTDPLKDGNFGLSEWLALGSAVIFGLQLQFVNRYTAGANAEAMTLAMFVHFAWMNAAALVCFSDGGSAVRALLHPSRALALSTVYLALAASVLAMWVFMRFQRHIPASRAAIVYCLEPVFAALLGIAFMSEPFTWRIAAGGVLILLANLLVELRKRKAASS
jgi:drug/metabolite transporter (DMT)-like permease